MYPCYLFFAVSNPVFFSLFVPNSRRCFVYFFLGPSKLCCVTNHSAFARAIKDERWRSKEAAPSLMLLQDNRGSSVTVDTIILLIISTFTEFALLW